MKLLSKSLLAAVFTLAPLSALAFPTDCDVNCVSPIPCSELCAIPYYWGVTTCGQWVASYDPTASCDPGVSSTPEDETAAVTQDSADGSEWVCRAPEASLSSEG
jgi:hypothetical protein